MGICFSDQQPTPRVSRDLFYSYSAGNDEYGGETKLIDREQEKELSDTKTNERMILIHSDAKRKHRQNFCSMPINLNKNFEVPFCPKPERVVELIESSLSDDFIFDGLSGDDRRSLIDAMSKLEVSAGSMIIEQGGIGDYFYVVEEGTVSYIVDGNVVDSTTNGACFGELALLYDSPRVASCRAETDCVLWRVDQYTFRYILAKNKTNYHEDIQHILKKVPFVSQLDEETLSKLEDALTPVSYSKGKTILSKGSVGNVFYILRDGKVKVHDIGHGDSQYVDQILEPGDFFGERALLTGETRAASITAVTDCSVLCLSREDFEKTLGNLQTLVSQASTKRILMSVPIFANNLDLHEISKLFHLFVEKTYPEGTILQKKNDNIYNSGLYIIRSGAVSISQDNGVIINLIKGDHFGGPDIIRAENGAFSSRTITVKEKACCAVLTKSAIKSVIGSISRLSQPQKWQPKLDRSIKLEHLELHHVLGEGSFGSVWLVSHKHTGKAYALKKLNKMKIIKKKQVENVMRERNVLACLNHPFILKLVSTFQDESFLYMLINFVQGGELFRVIRDGKGEGIPDSSAQFYAACILKALSCMHHFNICYRDLKPENTLIDKEGFCILIDMGFAKIVTDKTYTVCGTPEYFAPEIILSKGHNKGVDYWAFGVLIYEMLVGTSPFWEDGLDHLSLFKRIVRTEPSFPNSKMSAAAKNLIHSLLTKQPRNRLGVIARGDRDIYEHKWFNGVDFQKLRKKEIKAPWLPYITNEIDASNYDTYPDSGNESEHGHLTPLSDSQQRLFENF